MVYSPDALKKQAAPVAVEAQDRQVTQASDPLVGPGRVSAINIASSRVRECYRAEFKEDPLREQVVIVSFLAEIGEEGGVVSKGQVPPGDAVSRRFDRCVREGLLKVPFATTAPSGRQQITFPFVFDLSNNEEEEG